MRIHEISDASELRKYLKFREPVVLRGVVNISHSLIVDCVGKEYVTAEPFDVIENKYGNTDTADTRGRHRVQFGDVLKPDSKYYISTQPHSTSTVCPSVISKLIISGIVPILPFGKKINLMLHEINIWAGNSSATGSTSSGLHHDYHDNVYCLVSGKKTFELFAPSSLPNIPTYGSTSGYTKTFSNGLITYSQHIREDGANRLDAYDWLIENAEDDDIDRLLNARLALERLPRRRTNTSKPLNFCLPTSCEGLCVTLFAGDALYLPCSYFHNVTSSCGHSSDHIAINYWFYPPNKTGRYPDNFWKARSSSHIHKLRRLRFYNKINKRNIFLKWS